MIDLSNFYVFTSYNDQEEAIRNCALLTNEFTLAKDARMTVLDLGEETRTDYNYRWALVIPKSWDRYSTTFEKMHSFLSDYGRGWRAHEDFVRCAAIEAKKATEIEKLKKIVAKAKKNKGNENFSGIIVVEHVGTDMAVTWVADYHHPSQNVIARFSTRAEAYDYVYLFRDQKTK